MWKLLKFNDSQCFSLGKWASGRIVPRSHFQQLLHPFLLYRSETNHYRVRIFSNRVLWLLSRTHKVLPIWLSQLKHLLIQGHRAVLERQWEKSTTAAPGSSRVQLILFQKAGLRSWLQDSTLKRCSWGWGCGASCLHANHDVPSCLTLYFITDNWAQIWNANQ